MTIKWAGILVSLVLAFASGWYFGRLALELKDAHAVINQEVKIEKKTTTDEATVAQEAKTFENATDPLQPIAAPVVRVCHFTPIATVPSANPAGSGAHEATAVPAPALADPLPGPDIGRPLVQVGHTADAQVAGLQDYIERVCQAKAP